MAQCQYCQNKAGIFRRICLDCKGMLQVIGNLGNSFSFRTMLDQLMQVCDSNEKIERFLSTDLSGQGSIRDLITARMTNQLAHTMGQPTHMDALKVKVIREAEAKNPIPNDLPGAQNPYRR